MEIWKEVKVYPDYKISNLGQVKNKHGKVLVSINNHGYATLKLFKGNKPKRFSIHRLVAEAFIPNHENKETVNHINSIRNDNRVENLEWATPKENNDHRYNNEFLKRTLLVFDKVTGNLLHELDLTKVDIKKIYLKKL
jgi:hypothetical protein